LHNIFFDRIPARTLKQGVEHDELLLAGNDFPSGWQWTLYIR